MEDATYDIAEVESWLRSELGNGAQFEFEDTATGNVNSTLFVDVTIGDQVPQSLVVKTANEGGSVRRRSDINETAFLKALYAAGGPVPEVVLVDDSRPVATPRFAMRRIEGIIVPDDATTSYIGEGWLAEASAERQSTVWNSFHSALAAIHSAPVEGSVSELARKPHTENIEFWRQSLVDVCIDAPEQSRVLDWLLENAPADVNSSPAICMCDSRLANAIVRGDEVVALLDFELAYVGNPAADIAYSLFTDRVFSDMAGRRLEGFPDADATWELWQEATGRTCGDRDYWMVHAAMVLCITASRTIAGMVEPGTYDESMNPFVELLNKQVSGATI